ncbi:MAG: class I SAM-dependent methyltransferase [Magnetococcus sp. YQC-5]
MQLTKIPAITEKVTVPRENFPHPLVVAALEAQVMPQARQLAEALGLPLLDWAQTANQLVLTVTMERLELHARLQGHSQPMYVDFSAAIAHARRQEGLRQPLARAAGLKSGVRPSILDATPGLGRDAFVLAALGCPVRMVERSPVMVALLADGLRRAARECPLEASRMELCSGDAVSQLTQWPHEQRPDVIYLDPMHPERTKAALVKKEMRLLRELVGDDGDADALLQAALTHAGQRVVVKRPRLGVSLAGPAPQAVITGRTVRYDLYFPRQMGHEDLGGR